MKHFLIFLALIYLPGCNGPIPLDRPCDVVDCDEELSAEALEALCDRANEHIANCDQGTPGISAGRCDAPLARAVLSNTCDELNARLSRGRQLVDGGYFVFDDDRRRESPIDRFACAMGFNFACPAGQCEPDAWVEVPDEGDCDGWREYDDCGACGYYRCREAQAGCGEEGYLLGYVGRYCDRFATVTAPRVSAAAAEWLGRVRTCLVDYMAEEVPADASCEEIHRMGTASHTDCYVEAGFCELSILDWFAIVHTIDPGDVPLRQIFTTGHGCLQRWF